VHTYSRGYIPSKNSPGPVALHVCAESRAIAMRTYEPAFESMANGDRPPIAGSKIWIGFQRDVLYLHLTKGQVQRPGALKGSLVAFAAKDLAKIRKLAVCRYTLDRMFKEYRIHAPRVSVS
jgi:hypothetical protein